MFDASEWTPDEFERFRWHAVRFWHAERKTYESKLDGYCRALKSTAAESRNQFLDGIDRDLLSQKEARLQRLKAHTAAAIERCNAAQAALEAWQQPGSSRR